MTIFPVSSLSRKDKQLVHRSAHYLAELSEHGLPLVASVQHHKREITLQLPADTVAVLAKIMEKMHNGNHLVIDDVMTIEQAANFLQVCQHGLVDMLEDNELPSIVVDNQRLIRTKDVLAYRKVLDKRSKSLEQMVADAQEMGLY